MKEAMHRFSIVTPSFNQGQFLEQTILSVLGQDGVDIEYFVMDGGSTDNSVEIIEKYADRLQGWRSAPDDGQAWAINRGLEQCTGDIVAYINSDDYYPDDVFKRVSELFRDETVDWVAGVVEFIDGQGAHMQMQRPSPRDSLLESLVWGVDVGQPGVFFRRSLLDEVGLFDETLNYVFDTEYWLRLMRAGHSLVTRPDVFAVRRMHGDTKTELQPARFDAERERVRNQYSEAFSTEKMDRLAMLLQRKAVEDHISRAAAEARARRFGWALGEMSRALGTSPGMAIGNLSSRVLRRGRAR